MIIEGKYLFFDDDKNEVFEIRRQVFQIEQNIPKDIDIDEFEDESIHAIVYADKHPVAAGRLIYDGREFKIGRVAVLKEERGKSYGDFVVRLLIDKAFLMGANEILISSQIDAVDFYKKIGFKSYGEKYNEAGIVHQRMKLTRQSICTACRKGSKG